jgi:hypothetical protein
MVMTRSENQRRPRNIRDRHERNKNGANPTPEIQTIAGGFGGGGEASSFWKIYARHVKDYEVYYVQKPPKLRRCKTLVIRFSDDDYVGVSLSHTNALVVALDITKPQDSSDIGGRRKLG